MSCVNVSVSVCRKVSKKAKKTIQSIKKACVEVGFFQITGHGISLKEINKTCNVGNKFFNSSKINKQKFIEASGSL